QTVLVTGLAETNFESDLIVWDGSYNRQSFDMKSAYAQLKDDEKKIRTFLQSMGINDKEIAFSSVIINKDYVSETNERGGYTQRFNGYNLIQNVRIESSEVTKVESVYKDIAQLIDQGIELNSSAPRYYYSKLKDVKIDLLAKASSDAKLRAETIAKNSDAGLGKLVKSTMGIFQITGKNSDEDYSYGGSFNTSSKIKTASITVRSEYQLK
ncbi:MAG TPA: SIMPL domain-containing protein, partial [Chitinophagales bacterium]|nr:SIMPL domain-containing protein [Chitinophagales bacterium]